MRRKHRYWGRGLLDQPQLSLSVVSSCRKSMSTFKHPLGETFLSVIVLRTMKINSQDALSRLLAKTHLVQYMIKNWKRKTNHIHFKRDADQLYRCKMKKFLTRIPGLVNMMFTTKLLNKLSPPFRKIQKWIKGLTRDTFSLEKLKEQLILQECTRLEGFLEAR